MDVIRVSLSFFSSFLEQLYNKLFGLTVKSIRSKIVQNVIKNVACTILKKKYSNILRPEIFMLCSVRTFVNFFFLFFIQENSTQEKGRKEMAGGCTIDECA